MDSSDFISPNGRLVRAAAGSSSCMAFVPAPLPPTIDWDDELASRVSASDRALGELASLGRFIPNPHLLIAPFLRREAVLSSRIEGTQASVDDVYLFEAMAENSPEQSDVREVHNYVKAMNHGLERMRTLPLSRRLFCELHQILMTGVRGQERRQGEFRKQQNWIGAPGSAIEDASYVPPPPPDMNEALDDLERYIHTPSNLPPLMRLAIIHYQFEAIHPFEDGNGRIGRLLIVLCLCIDGLLPGPLLYISDYLERWRQEYYAHLRQVSTCSTWNEWIKFFLQAATQAARDGSIRARRLIDLQKTLQEEFAGTRSHTVRRLVDLLFSSPVIVAPQAAKALDVTPTSVQRAIDRLIQHSVLSETTGGTRNRIYVARAILEAIADRNL